MFHFTKTELLVLFSLAASSSIAQAVYCDKLGTCGEPVAPLPTFCTANSICAQCISSGCFWYPNTNTCQATDSFNGVRGTDVCTGTSTSTAGTSSTNRAPLTDTTTTTTTSATGGSTGISPPAFPELPPKCSANNCMGCVIQSGCAWTSEHTCILDNCVSLPAGSFCYSPGMFLNMNLADICELYDTREADNIICNVPTDCETCTSTRQSDGTSTCQWYQELRTGRVWCGTGVVSDVSGADSCSSPVVAGTGTGSDRKPGAVGDKPGGHHRFLRF